jgi:hypothetical protein
MRGKQIRPLEPEKASYPNTDHRRAYMRAYMAKRRAPAKQRLRAKREILAAALLFLRAASADAHNEWADGSTIPDWVKASCCGPADAHHLRPDQVHRISEDYYQVDGYVRRIPAGQALPSQDGDYWIFYRDDGGGSQSGVYCFFVPMAM